MPRVPQLLENAWDEIPQERQTKQAEGSQERRQPRGLGTDLSWPRTHAARTYVREHTWPESRLVLYGSTERKCFCSSSQEDSLAPSQNCPNEASQLLPDMARCPARSKRRQEELVPACKSGHTCQGGGDLARGKREEHQHLGRNKHKPMHPCEPLHSMKWKGSCLKNGQISCESELWTSMQKRGLAKPSGFACSLGWNKCILSPWSPWGGKHKISFATFAFYWHLIKYRKENRGTEMVVYGNKKERKTKFGIITIPVMSLWEHDFST